MQLKNISISYGTQTVLSDINLLIPANEKIGVVGVNGAGKTTLFKVIMHIETPDTGKISFSHNERVDWLPQVISDNEDTMQMTVLEYVRSGRPISDLEEELQTLYETLSDSERSDSDSKRLFSSIEKIQKKLDYWESYSAEATLHTILSGLGIEVDDMEKRLSELSGGQKSKVAFAKLLYSKPEIMLLDEPTNHLDAPSRQYIVSFLKHYRGTVLVISHDIDFLNQTTSKTLFLDKRNKSATLYNGNYEQFQKVRSAQEDSLLHQAHIQEQEEQHLRSIINKYSTASGNKKRMAQDREKKLERLLAKKIVVYKPDKAIQLNMTMNRESSNIPLRVSNLCFRYSQKKNAPFIIEALSFDVYKGEKFLIVGENGVGKSTLLKLVVGVLTPNQGHIIIQPKTDFGYYAQELENLDFNSSLLDNFHSVHKPLREIRGVLGKFLFFGDDVHKKVQVLSPGERSRVALAKLSMSGANFLVLDEPTNHLDPETQLIISEVFRTFEGSMLIVSHNPEFVDSLGIERILILPEGIITYYDRDTVEYYQHLNSKNKK